jgi:hypothetical protein
VKFNDPVNNIIINIAELNINSYEIIAAVDLNEPKNAYLELADQPANNTPYTPKEDKAKLYNTPNEKSDRANPSPNGIIPQPNKLNTKVEAGAK